MRVPERDRRRRGNGGREIDSSTLRCLLLEPAGSLPEEGPGQVTGVGVRQGWGGIFNVQVHTSFRRPTEWELGREVRSAVDRALGARRHDLAFVWDATSEVRLPPS